MKFLRALRAAHSSTNPFPSAARKSREYVWLPLLGPAYVAFTSKNGFNAHHSTPFFASSVYELVRYSFGHELPCTQDASPECENQGGV